MGFDSWLELVRGIKAGLLMLGKSRAVEVVDAITEQLRRVMQPGGMPLSGAYLDRLADAVVSLEYYIETLQAGRSDPWYMLDNAQACLEVLQREPEQVVPTVPAVSPANYARTVRIGPPPQALAAAEAADLESTGHALTPPVLTAAPLHTASVSDPELLSLFAEEAREEMEKIRRYYPAWDQDPLATEALGTVRRSFHTLKGSGRMVGARELSEFSWAMENLVNRLLDGTLARSPEILDYLARSRGLAAPAGRRADRGRRAHHTSCAAGRARARARRRARRPGVAGGGLGAGSAGGGCAPGRGAGPAETGAPAGARMGRHRTDRPAATSRAEAPAESPAEAAAEGGDAALREIYARETSSHVLTVRSWLAREQPHPAPHVLTEEVYRACHTLSGSSRMAEARHGTRLAEPLNHWLRKSFDSGVGLDDSDLLLLADCMTAMAVVANHLDEDTAFFAMHDTLRARIARAEHELDRRIAEATEHSERTGLHALPAMQALRQPEPPAAPAAPVSAPVIDFDPEVASIFCEEASELLEASQSALQAWNAAPAAEGEQLASLKRSLHTFKGGARMAGVSAMGDLSHELESLIVQIGLGTASGDQRARAIAQEALDELARMREQVAGGRAAAPATALMERIQAIARGAEVASEPAPSPAVLVAAATPPVAEPEPAAAPPKAPAPAPTPVAGSRAAGAAGRADRFGRAGRNGRTAPAQAGRPGPPGARARGRRRAWGDGPRQRRAAR